MELNFINPLIYWSMKHKKSSIFLCRDLGKNSAFTFHSH